MASSRPNVLVVGSLNIDYIASVDCLPAPGETVPASGLIQRFGGKGANQAVAAARQGARVSMIGCVGDDDNGRAYRRRLIAEKVNVRALFTTSKALTGTALIAVDGSAENIIIVAPGANGQLRSAAVRNASGLIGRSAFVLLQFEVPMNTVIATVEQANKCAAAVVLNPSPYRQGFPWGKFRLDTLITNELEAQAIFGMPLDSVKGNFAGWSRALREKKVERLVITRGGNPTLCLDQKDCFEIPGLKVKPVDTVGAGDAFAGTFAARRAEGEDVLKAIQYANCAGALATLKRGAQESIPTRFATDKAFRRLIQKTHGQSAPSTTASKARA